VRPWVQTGWWYMPPGGAAATAMTLNRIYYQRLPVPSGGASIDRIAVEVTTGGTAGAVVRLGVYDATTGGRPGSLLLDAGTVDSESPGIKELTVSLALSGGLKWLTAVVQGANCSLRVVPATADVNEGQSVPANSTAITSPGGALYPIANGPTGALPASAIAPTNVSIGPRLSVRWS
jgi:hypothetical protein